MKVIHSGTELKAGGRKVCLAIGFFDGVHLGHQQLLRQTLADARKHEGLAVVVTFDTHPSVVVQPERIPPLIYCLRQRLKVIRSERPDALLLLHFTREMSLLSAQEFICRIVNDIGTVQSLTVGANFLFGHKRSGDVTLLKRLGRDYNFSVHGMAAVSLDGKPVSSTRIREAILTGNLDCASQMLGRPYSICGLVTKGDRIGHKMGFPTANIDAGGLALPPNGVYAAHVETGGKTLRAVLNIGLRPTLNQPNATLRVEAHLLGFDGDLYGRDLEVIPLARLRNETKFASLEELKARIRSDICNAERYFQGESPTTA